MPTISEPLLSRHLRWWNCCERSARGTASRPAKSRSPGCCDHPAVTGAIVGRRRPGQLKELVGAADWRLTAGEVNEIETFLSTNAGK